MSTRIHSTDDVSSLHSEGQFSPVAQKEYVTVVVGGQTFGLPILEVQDVFSPSHITRVPLASSEIEGVLNLRGKIVTAICMRRRLGMSARGQDAPRMAVGVEFQNESYGLIIDRVGEVARFAHSDLESNPVNLDSNWVEVSDGVFKQDSKLIILLNVGRLLTRYVRENAA